MCYLCGHEEVNDLDNSNSYGTILSRFALSSDILYRRDGKDEEGAV